MTCLNCSACTYRLDCVDCCVLLVKSARSDLDPKTARKFQDGHLEHIAYVVGESMRTAVVALLQAEKETT